MGEPASVPDPRDGRIAELEKELAAVKSAAKPAPTEKGLPAVVDQDALRRLGELEKEIALLKSARLADSPDEFDTPFTQIFRRGP